VVLQGADNELDTNSINQSENYMHIDNTVVGANVRKNGI
jgi:hypothetical protein